MNPAPRRIAILGGGMAGLAAAHEASLHAGCEPVLFEASHRFGGIVETVHQAGFTIECGPDSWVTERTEARLLAEELGLGSQLIVSNDGGRRTYLAKDSVRGRELLPLPDGMRMMVPTRWAPILESPLFSRQARLAYLREPRRAAELKAFAATRTADDDESVRSFVMRHFGEEATRTVAAPLLAGVFGGNIDTLSAGAVLAPFVQLEREYGSLIAPLMARAQKQQSAPIFTTLRDGLGALVAALADRLAAALPPGSIRLHTPVVSIAQTPRGWAVRTPGNEDHFDAVILAVPTQAARGLLAAVDREASELLPHESTSAVVVSLCFSAEASAGMRVPRGFGFLVAPAPAPGSVPSAHTAPEYPLLAGTFMHQKFPARAPQGSVFLRGFFGGETAARMQHLDDETVVELAGAGFARILGAAPRPAITLVRRWPHSLPQYAVGHPARMRALAKRLQSLPGLALAGNGHNGVGLSAVIGGARTAVRDLIAPHRAAGHDEPASR